MYTINWYDENQFHPKLLLFISKYAFVANFNNEVNCTVAKMRQLEPSSEIIWTYIWILAPLLTQRHPKIEGLWGKQKLLQPEQAPWSYRGVPLSCVIAPKKSTFKILLLEAARSGAGYPVRHQTSLYYIVTFLLHFFVFASTFVDSGVFLLPATLAQHFPVRHQTNVLPEPISSTNTARCWHLISSLHNSTLVYLL